MGPQGMFQNTVKNSNVANAATKASSLWGNANWGTVSPYLGVASAAMSAISGGINASKIKDASSLEEYYKNSTSDMYSELGDDLEDTLSTHKDFYLDTAPRTEELLQYSKGEQVANALNTGFSTGISAGMAAGPLGAAIGAGIGMLSSGIGAIRANKKAYNEHKKLEALRNEAYDTENKLFQNNLKATYNKIQTQTKGNITAYGGPINMKYSGSMSPFGNRYAFGGDMLSKGADWSNGYTIIDNGGTHEENPNEGVQMGVDSQGIPNLVEEGEVIFNNYVFSNRMKVPKAVRNRYKLRGTKDLTFADAAKELSKEAKERPNDPISNRGLKTMLGGLQEVQEDERFKKEMRNPEKRKQLMMQLAAQQNQQAQAQQQVQPQQEDVEATQYACGGRLGKKFSGLGIYPQYLQGFNIEPTDYLYTDKGAKTNIPNMYPITGKTSDWNPLEGTSAEINNRQNIETPYALEDTYNSNNNIDSTSSETKSGFNASWLRYAPVIGSAISVMSDAFSKPNYSYANEVLKAANKMGEYDTVSAEPIGDYLTYRPFDINYVANQIRQQGNTQLNSIRNLSAGNRATAMMQQLANNYSIQNALANAYRQAEEYNLNQREKVATFNRGTNQFNSEMGLKAAMANQEAKMKANNARYSGVVQAMNMKDTIDARRAASKSANLTNLFNSLGDIGKEAATRNMINTNSGLYYSISSDGKISYKNGYEDLSEYEKAKVRRNAEKDLANRQKEIEKATKAAQKLARKSISK